MHWWKGPGVDAVLGPSLSHHTTVPAWTGRGTCSLWGPPGAKGRVQRPIGCWGLQFLWEVLAGLDIPQARSPENPRGTWPLQLQVLLPRLCLDRPSLLHLSVSLPGPHCTLSPSQIGRTLVGFLPFLPCAWWAVSRATWTGETDLQRFSSWVSTGPLRPSSPEGLFGWDLRVWLCLLFGGGVGAGVALLCSAWTEGVERVGASLHQGVGLWAQRDCLLGTLPLVLGSFGGEWLDLYLRDRVRPLPG